MIPHHQAPIDMAKVQLELGMDPEMRKLAEKVIAAQEAEMADMNAWLAAKGMSSSLLCRHRGKWPPCSQHSAKGELSYRSGDASACQPRPQWRQCPLLCEARTKGGRSGQQGDVGMSMVFCLAGRNRVTHHPMPCSPWKPPVRMTGTTIRAAGERISARCHARSSRQDKNRASRTTNPTSKTAKTSP